MTDTQTSLPHAYGEDEISLLDVLVALAESWKLLVFGPLLVGVLVGGLSVLRQVNTYESVSILRLAEEDALIMYTTPVLDVLIDKFDWLKEGDDSEEDVRKKLIQMLAIGLDKRSKLVTLTAKARSPEQAQALCASAIEVLVNQLKVKGADKDALLKIIASNQRAILVAQEAQDILQNSIRRGTVTSLSKESLSSLIMLNSEIFDRTEANVRLSRKLVAPDENVYVQKATLPVRESVSYRGAKVITAVLVSGFALLLLVYVRLAWQRVAKKFEAAEKIKRIKSALGVRGEVEANTRNEI